VRVNDQCILASKVTVDLMKRQQSPHNKQFSFTPLERGILHMVEEQVKVTMPQVCQAFNISRRRATRILVNLLSVGVLRSHTTEKVEFYSLGEP
jgi:predicted HTH transcriptional regulator